MQTKQESERRKSVRLKGRKEAILVHPNGINHISDISSGGLSFHCSQEDFFPDQWLVAIVYAGTPLYITGLSVGLVKERIEESTNFLTTPNKKVGVKFLAVDDNKHAQLATLFTYLSDGTPY